MILDRRSSDDGAARATLGRRHAARRRAGGAGEPGERRPSARRASASAGDGPAHRPWAAGKTTLAYALERRLFDAGRAVARARRPEHAAAISRDLGFTAADRSENLRRSAEVARLLNDAGLICAARVPGADGAVRDKARDGDRRRALPRGAPRRAARGLPDARPRGLVRRPTPARSPTSRRLGALRSAGGAGADARYLGCCRSTSASIG